MKQCLFFVLSVFSFSSVAQIKEEISYIDSVDTNKYKSKITFYANSKGFTYQEIKVYKKHHTTNTITIWGESATIDSDSIKYVYYKNKTLLILQSVIGDSFEYSESIKKGSQGIKYYSHQIDRWSIKLPFLETKNWLKSIW